MAPGRRRLLAAVDGRTASGAPSYGRAVWRAHLLMSTPTESQSSSSSWRQRASSSGLWLFAAALTLGLTLALAFNLVAPSNVSVVLDEPAPNDILSPRSLTYTSEILTEQAREQASAAVADVYTPIDLSIGRAQLSQAQAVFAFIDVVRADSQASLETKLSYLQGIEGLTIEGAVGKALLEMSQSDYEEAKSDTLSVIDELMRQEIRKSQLRDYQRIARRQASLELSPTQAAVVTSLPPQFIVPTVFADEGATARLRQEARDSVEPVTPAVRKDERIVRAGDIVTELDIEVLTELGLLRREPDWRDVGSLLIASLLSVSLLTLYWHQFHRSVRNGGRYLTLLAAIIFVFVLGARLTASGPGFLLYWYPIAAMSMLLAVIFDVRLSMLATIIVAALIGFISQSSLELTVYAAAGGLLSLLTLDDVHAQRVNAFFRAGLVAAVGHIVVIVIFRLPQNAEVLELMQLVLYALGNGILSAALTLAGFFIIGSLFGVTTTLQLQDLSRLDHPLLQELLRRAPGTYHHSIMVANLAEQAAERVRANSTMVRVGAFYHDVGKMKRPPFFSENQEGVNPHDSLDPYSSARIIIGHVSDGLELARRYRLPDRIRDFIAEHHGVRLVKSFYQRAIEQAGGDAEQVDAEKFRHKGPRPHSRESGIVMLADAIDATSNALRPNSEKAIEKLVNSIIDEHLTEGQLDESGLTLGDIKMIRSSFINTLKGRFHMRVKYPGNEELEVESEIAPAAAETTAEQRPQPLPNPAPLSSDIPQN
ncbi:MAG: HD family phosphohydrolase [Anaerolineae bacterium]